jgi:tetratricopeptide (TPR) repeat protein
MSGAPKTIAEVLIGEINAFKETYPRHELTYKRLEKKADKLVQTDAVAGYAAHGMLASLNNDAASATNYFEKALRLAPNDFTALSNYMVSLRNQCLMSELHPHIDRLISLANTPEQKGRAALFKLLSYIDTGNFDGACGYFKENTSLIESQFGDKNTREYQDVITKLPKASEFIKQYQIDSKLLTEYFFMMASLIHKEDLNFWQTSFFPCITADEPCLIIDMHVVCDNEKASDLNFKLAEQLSITERFDSLTDRVVCKYIAH